MGENNSGPKYSTVSKRISDSISGNPKTVQTSSKRPLGFRGAEIDRTRGSDDASERCIPKKDSGYRPVINLKSLNQYIPYQHFKMDATCANWI